MKYTRLGRTDLKVSRVGIGGIPIQRPTEKEAVKLVKYALDQGINLIDTSRYYGTSEERIGKAIADRRDEVTLITRQPYPTRKEAKEQLQISLQTLKTDYIDIWQFHNVTESRYDTLLAEGNALDFAKEKQKEGIIKFIGLTSHCSKTMEKAIRSEEFDVVLYPFNFVNNEVAETLIPLAEKLDIGFTAMKPFAGGRLSNAKLVMSYILQFDNVIPVPGVESPAEIDEIVELVNSGYTLTDEDLVEMNKIRTELGTKFCQWCGYCMPTCPENIYIPGVINVAVNYNVWPVEEFAAKNKPRIDGGRKCTKCGECETHCPYELPIRDLIVKGIAFYEEKVTSITEN